MSTLKVEKITNLGGEDKFSRKFVNTVTLSGATVPIAGIPTWANEVSITFNGAVGSIASGFAAVKLGSSSGIESTGYTGSQSAIGASNSSGSTNFSTSFLVTVFQAIADTYVGTVVLKRHSGNTWVLSSTLGKTNNAYGIVCAGSKTVAGALNQLEISHTTGSFTGGTVTVTAME